MHARRLKRTPILGHLCFNIFNANIKQEPNIRTFCDFERAPDLLWTRNEKRNSTRNIKIHLHGIIAVSKLPNVRMFTSDFISYPFVILLESH